MDYYTVGLFYITDVSKHKTASENGTVTHYLVV